MQTSTPSEKADGTHVLLVSRNYYDDQGRLVAAMEPAMYDLAGQYSLDGDSRITHTLYDELGRVIETPHCGIRP